MIKTDRNTSKTVKIYLQCEVKLGNDTFEDHEVCAGTNCQALEV